MTESIEEIMREYSLNDQPSPTMEAALPIAVALEEDLQKED